MNYEAVVIGASWGGVHALQVILSLLPKSFPIPIFIVQHLSAETESYLANFLKSTCEMPVIEAQSMLVIEASTVYIAPPNYHMLIEKANYISLSVEEKVNYSRPSIDLLFQTAAEKYRDRLIGIVLTGANADGSRGLARIKELGGYTIVQNPKEAESDFMPWAAINATEVNCIINIDEIGPLIIKLVTGR